MRALIELLCKDLLSLCLWIAKFCAVCETRLLVRVSLLCGLCLVLSRSEMFVSLCCFCSLGLLWDSLEEIPGLVVLPGFLPGFVYVGQYRGPNIEWGPYAKDDEKNSCRIHSSRQVVLWLRVWFLFSVGTLCVSSALCMQWWTIAPVPVT